MPLEPAIGRYLKCATICIAMGVTSMAGAASYPERPITIIVPFTPGGTVDMVGRIIANRLTETLGQTVLVENRGGASGSIGTALAVRAKPDGYTLLVGSTTTVSIRPKLAPAVPFDIDRDLVPIGLIASVPQVMLVTSKVPAKNVAELIAFAKAGKVPLSYADAGLGTPQYLAGELFKKSTGVDITHISYKGGGEKHNDMIAGHVQLGSVELSVAAPYMTSGQLRAIGIAASKRDKKWPDVPTFAEQGIPDYEISSWFGLFAPAGTPPAIVAKLNEEIQRATLDAKQREAMDKIGLVAEGGSQQDFSTFLMRESKKWAEAIKSANMELKDPS